MLGVLEEDKIRFPQERDFFVSDYLLECRAIFDHFGKTFFPRLSVETLTSHRLIVDPPYGEGRNFILAS